MTTVELFFSPKGRIGRQQYWIAVILLGVATAIVASIVGSSSDAGIFGMLLIPLIWSSFAVTVKRLHDRGKSAWLWLVWFVCALIPVVNIATGIWALIELGCLEGMTPGAPKPLANANTPPLAVSEKKSAVVGSQPVPMPEAVRIPPAAPKRTRSLVNDMRALTGPDEAVAAAYNEDSSRPRLKKTPAKPRQRRSQGGFKDPGLGLDVQSDTPRVDEGEGEYADSIYNAKIVLQKMIEDASGTLVLIPNEYEGPIVFTRSADVDGRNSTVIGRKSPVVTIRRGPVVLRNISIEVLGDRNRDVALQVQPHGNLQCENVVIVGCVSGMSGESGEWQIPIKIDAQSKTGEIPTFTLKICTPVPCRLESRITELEIVPNELSEAGDYTLVCRVKDHQSSVHYYGDIIVKTVNFVRRIPFTLAVVDEPVGVAGSELLTPRDIALKQGSTKEGGKRRVVRQEITKLGGWMDSGSGGCEG